MEEKHLFEIAKILDGEYIGSEKTFSAKRYGGCWNLTTNKCDMASLIRIWEKNNKISTIKILSPDNEGWTDITNYSWTRISQYLESLN